MSRGLLVLDASVGVKWMKAETGADEAREIADRHADGEITIVVSDVFMYEVVHVARRLHGASGADAMYDRLAALAPVVVPTDATAFNDVMRESRRLGCTTYDAAAPALAERLDATLVSADERAHGSFPGVRLIG